MGLRSRIKGRLKKLLDDAQERQAKPSGFDVRVTERPPVSRGTASPPPSEPGAKPPSSAPPETSERRVVRAPVVVKDTTDDVGTGDKVRILAEPQKDDETCRFLVNRGLVSGVSWYFEDAESGLQSSLAKRLFELPDVETVAIDESTVTVTRDGDGEWEALAQSVGQAIRDTMDSGEDVLEQSLVERIPDEETIRTRIQACIDEEVNPGVAAHSGYISLTRIRGNSVYIQMGGGCQGCSAADLTLKQGIHQAFRKAVPEVGAIYDETDHAAGLNPYFS